MNVMSSHKVWISSQTEDETVVSQEKETCFLEDKLKEWLYKPVWFHIDDYMD